MNELVPVEKDLVKDLVLQRLDTARTALMEAKTVQETKKILDVATAMEILAKRQKLGEEAIKYATEIKIEALCQLGHMLSGMEKNKGIAGGGDRNTAGSTTVLADTTPTLAKMGLDKKTSKLAQDIAELSDEKLEEVKQGILSLSRVSLEKKVNREANKSNFQEEPEIPEGTFNVVLADPPWCYGDKHSYNGTTGAEDHYPSMTIGELSMEVGRLRSKGLYIADDAVLFLWVTSPLLDECWDVIKSWGFEYKTSFVWDKVKHNMGHYNSVRHEFLLVCTRGSMLPETPTLFDSVITEERSEVHSQKPEKVYEIIETLYPSGKYLELFSRKRRERWASYGNEL